MAPRLDFFGQVYDLDEELKLFFWVLRGLKNIEYIVQIISEGLRSILGFCKRTTIPSLRQLKPLKKNNVAIYC